MKTWLIGMVLLLVVGASPLFGQDTPSTPNVLPSTELEQVGRVLLVFLVLSVVFEVALTPIFNWRVFLARFEGKGVKTPVAVILAFIVFWGYGLDIISDLLVALNYKAERSFGGQVLTALLIAGGSDGVFRIFTKLNIRDPEARKEKAAEAQAQRAERLAESKGTSGTNS
jgi:hypothetical protein